VRTQRLALVWGEFFAPAIGVAATLATAYASVRMGAGVGIGATAVAVVFVVSVLGFVFTPHLMVAALIPLYALIPAMKVFLTPEIGPLKDLITLAATVAALAIVVFDRSRLRRHPPDVGVLAAVGLLIALYLVNVGGRHGVAWAQGVRLIGEPLLLLVCGFVLPNPRRTLRFAIVSLIGTACLVAAYGVVQQAVGGWALVGWGYSFSDQVRTFNGHLRSFGTLDDPFAYAAFLLLGLAAVFFSARRGLLAWACSLVIVAGIASSWVRTSSLIGTGLIGLWIGRKGYRTSAILVVAATGVAAAFLLVTEAGATESRSLQSSTSNLTLNGRTSAWKAALGEPREWPFGRGVGTVGTAAYRAGYTITRPRSSQPAARAVDSGYLAAIADVGIAGLAVLLALLSRLLVLARDAARNGHEAGWFAIALLIVLLLDAVTRSSFTGFPTAFVGLLLVGLALAAAAEEAQPSQAPAPPSSRPLLPSRWTA
jgi:hypothetical protein